MQKKLRFVLPGIALSFLVIGFWGYYLYNKPHQSTGKLNPDIVINAEDLYNQFFVSETEANKKYINKIIKVKGKVSEVTTTGATQIYILEKQSGGGVDCEMAPSENIKKAIIEKGSIINVKGRCTGFLVDVNLVDCVIDTPETIYRDK